MLNTTVKFLRCPRRQKSSSSCGGELNLFTKEKQGGNVSREVEEVKTGHLTCQKCHSKFPILAGIAVLVDDVHFYLMSHAKGIAKIVPDSDIPREYLKEFREVKAELQEEHIEEDLEAERVNALYLMNHYLRVEAANLGDAWWQPLSGPPSPLIDSLVREYWDKGPFSQIERWMIDIEKKREVSSVVELGCGVGGLFQVLRSHTHDYLGVDSSFASIALARHLALGVPYRGELKVPADLLQGPVSRKIEISSMPSINGKADFIVGELERLPLRPNQYDLSVALNAIDMLEDPSVLPRIQHHLLKKGGVAIQSCPYIWHGQVAKRLRAKLPRDIKDSARAVEWLYVKAGFQIEATVAHQPWLFFKNVRQIEVYSVHMFQATREEIK
jgi:SAM-dependent methyltransferase